MMGYSALAKAGKLSWAQVLGIVVGSTALAVLAGFAVHKWRMRRMMQSEIQSIMYGPPLLSRPRPRINSSHRHTYLCTFPVQGKRLRVGVIVVCEAITERAANVDCIVRGM